MAVPKQRQNKSRGRRRRAGHKEVAQQGMVTCSNCSQSILPHKVCPNCGFYKGVEVEKKITKTKKKK
jgi:large subunit ribosomal protein L32